MATRAARTPRRLDPGLIERRRASVPKITYPPDLPVSARREDLLATIRDHQVVVVAGETGSGKTTQLPKICLELGRGIEGTIAHTQPRRIAARTVAQRIADELAVELGEAIGYSVRFNARAREETLVRLMTDGLLLAEIGRDRLLRRYDTIIVDEAHERSLNIDFLLGYVKSILPQRPDLKLIITSATIDPERFARHFDDAPVVEVSGRTYPVEVRYRPLVVPPPAGADPEAEPEERDQVDAIADAVDELAREAPGDVLVFLSGEREIRDTAEALRGRLRKDVEILPLYARLSTAEQQRVWQPHSGRRIVLATNVAETSLTVPGIRYVVDPGSARISRYSARLKVQRLPIEPISQASADQRKGRSGRTSPGIAIRLYSEEDFLERPRFTDPEILRTSLAAVILQMAAIGLGDIEKFPFLDPPDARQIRDGVNLLHELGALDPAAARLTKLGRKLADLPVDPRLGRMVLEADRRNCADEVIVIAAALSIQDPRERPQEKQAQADQLHARFADESSDFLSYLKLWNYLREQKRELSGNQLRKLCKGEFLHYLRVREWQDLAGQLRQAAKSVGVRLNQEPASADDIHRALLAGLLSHVGMKDVAKRDYVGARGARFQIFPGSALARRGPSWVMVAELVETSRLWGRVAARIDPRWIEPVAGHLVRRTYDAPHWDRKRASVVATERVSMYGLPIVAGRSVQYGTIDPELSRELFIRSALVHGEWDARHAFLRANEAVLEEVDELEQRERRRDLRVNDEALFEFFDARVPDGVVSGAHFDSWWKKERQSSPELLNYTRELVISASAADGGGGRPSSWLHGPLELQLSYSFEPGSEHDGVTVHVPLEHLGALNGDDFDWLVPALRLELITALIRSLPKALRRELVPVPDVAAALLDHVAPRTEPLLDALSRGLEEIRGVRVPREAWDMSRLPPHLRMGYRVEDERGRVVAEGNELAALRERVRPLLRSQLADATRGLERTGARDWVFGTLPRNVTLPGGGPPVRAYPALVDERSSVGVRSLDTAEAQVASMRVGTRRLLLLTVPSPVKWVTGQLSASEQLELAAAPHGSAAAVLDDIVAAAVDSLVIDGGGPAWDEESWRRLRDHVAGSLAERSLQVARWVVAVLAAARAARSALALLPPGEQLDAVRHDVEDHVDRLVHAGFVAEAGLARLEDVARYLRGIPARLERLPAGVARDADHMRTVQEIEDAYWARLEAWPEGRAVPPALEEIHWMIEELRMSYFAQALGVRGSVSAKRVRRALAEAPAAP